MNNSHPAPPSQEQTQQQHLQAATVAIETFRASVSPRLAHLDAPLRNGVIELANYALLRLVSESVRVASVRGEY